MTNQIPNPNDRMNDGARERWDDFVISSPGSSFLQSWAWGELQEKLGVPYWRLAVEEAGSLQAVALVLRREVPLGRCWLYAPRGPVIKSKIPSLRRVRLPDGQGYGWQANPNDQSNPKSQIPNIENKIQRWLEDLAREQGAVFMRTEPAAVPRVGWQKADHDVQPAHTLVADLDKGEEELLARMHQKTRYNIRLARRKEVEVRFSREQQDVESFIKLSREVTSRGGFHYHPDDYYRTMWEVLAPANMLELAVAEYKGVVLGVYWLITFGLTVTYVHGATAAAKGNVMAPHLLMWESIKRAKRQGAAIFDFFGAAPRGAGVGHPWAGITRFKEGFGGRRESYAGAYDYVLQPGMYTALNLARRARGMLL